MLALALIACKLLAVIAWLELISPSGFITTSLKLPDLRVWNAIKLLTTELPPPTNVSAFPTIILAAWVFPMFKIYSNCFT